MSENWMQTTRWQVGEGPQVGIVLHLCDIYQDVWNVTVDGDERQAREQMLTLLQPAWIPMDFKVHKISS